MGAASSPPSMPYLMLPYLHLLAFLHGASHCKHDPTDASNSPSCYVLPFLLPAVLYARILLPTASATATAARVTAAAARAAALALWRAAIRAATLTWQHVVRPVATRVVVPLLRAAAPVLWPGGAVAGTAWFVAQGVRQGHVLPYGPAAYASAVISCLMLGKAMRVSSGRRKSLWMQRWHADFQSIISSHSWCCHRQLLPPANSPASLSASRPH